MGSRAHLMPVGGLFSYIGAKRSVYVVADSRMGVDDADPFSWSLLAVTHMILPSARMLMVLPPPV